MTEPIADLDLIESVTWETREKHRRWARAKPLVRLWANPPEGEYDRGLVLRGRLCGECSGSFSFGKWEASSGQLKIPVSHYLAKWILSVPNDSEAKKNIVVTVDVMGGRMRWSGLLDNWKASRDADGLRWLEVTFIDDLQFLSFMLAPPNPALPIPIFQFPRVLPLWGPTTWIVSLLILINLMRLQGNWYTLPDDPGDWESWTDSLDMSTWQVLIDMPSLLSDSSLWCLLATRMDRIDTAIADALDDARQTISYRRVLTVDGESLDSEFGMSFPSDCRNGTLVLKVEDRAGFYNADGTAFGGGIAGGFVRTLVDFADGYVESIFTTISDDEEIYPEEYYGSNFWRQLPSRPWIHLRDTRWSNINTLELGYRPAGPTSVIVGGDNPYADQLAELLIQSVGNILGYFALGGFSSAGDIAATVIMPFLVGTILAWLQWENFSRAQNLGWVHLFETYQQGGESNAWSIAAIAALRAGFEATDSETSHVVTLTGAGPIYPGLHLVPGLRVGSSCAQLVPGVLFVEQVEQMVYSWDWSGSEPARWEVQIGKNEAGLSSAERSARKLSKALDTLQNIGVRLIS